MFARKTPAAFGAARRGAVAIVFAFTMPVLLLASSFAADYMYASYVNQRLSEGADAAAMAAVSVVSGDMAGGYSDMSVMQAFGQKVFAANVADLNLTGLTTNVTVAAGGPTAKSVTSTATYSWTDPTFLGGITKIKNINESGSASATAAPTTYINYYIIVDNSQSMGIGEDTTALWALYNRVQANGLIPWDKSQGCVFGCHVKAPWQGQNDPSFEDLAHLPKYGSYISLRIDAARNAVTSVIQSAQSNAGSVGNIKIGLYLTDTPNAPSSTATVTQLVAPTNDYTSLLNTYAPGIVLTNDQSSGDSEASSEINTFVQNYAPSSNGDGSSASSPLNYFLIITDGLDDTCTNNSPNWNCETGHYWNASVCNPLKNLGTVGVVYTTYLFGNGMGNDAQYQGVVEPWQGDPTQPGYVDQLWTHLQSCASSSSLAFQASDGTGITTALNALFSSTLQMARLTK